MTLPLVAVIAPECPTDLDEVAREVWTQLAPHALAARTLTAGMVTAFALLCRSIVLEKRLSLSTDIGQASHRGMIQRVEAGLVRFGLAPNGKPITPEVQSVDPFAEFEAAR